MHQPYRPDESLHGGSAWIMQHQQNAGSPRRLKIETLFYLEEAA
jgi:hypothetical protein